MENKSNEGEYQVKSKISDIKMIEAGTNLDTWDEIWAQTWIERTSFVQTGGKSIFDRKIV